MLALMQGIISACIWTHNCCLNMALGETGDLNVTCITKATCQWLGMPSCQAMLFSRAYTNCLINSVNGSKLPGITNGWSCKEHHHSHRNIEIDHCREKTMATLASPPWKTTWGCQGCDLTSQPSSPSLSPQRWVWNYGRGCCHESFSDNIWDSQYSKLCVPSLLLDLVNFQSKGCPIHK